MTLYLPPSNDARYCDDPGGTVLCAESTSCTVFGGTNPTNIIPSVATMSGVVCALILPFIGAMVDYSRRRWETVAATVIENRYPHLRRRNVTHRRLHMAACFLATFQHHTPPYLGRRCC